MEGFRKMTESKKTTIKKGSSKTEEIRSCLQKAETQLDSLTQKLVDQTY